MIAPKYYASIFICIFSYTPIYSGIICNSIPKCGTNLVRRLFNLLDIKDAGSCYSYSYLHLNENKIANIPENHFIWNHAMYNSENVNIIKSFNHKTIFIYRDPRDQIISFINYMQKVRPHRWLLENLSQNELISLMIEDYSLLYKTYKPSLWNDPLLLTIGNINNFYTLFLPWIQCPFVYTTTFEKLVGPRGGGSKKQQLQEIKNICNHLGIPKTEKEIKIIARKLFGKRTTFFKGQIGQWKTCFSKTQKERFKVVAGQLLIDLGYEADLDW